MTIVFITTYFIVGVPICAWYSRASKHAGFFWTGILVWPISIPIWLLMDWADDGTLRPLLLQRVNRWLAGHE